LAGEIRIGTSGYSFKDWVGPIYPERLPQKEWLSYYAREFNTVEINSTYCRVPSPYMMATLVRKVRPKAFVFVVKVPKEMTHDRGEFDDTVELFLSGIQPMLDAGCLGSLLAQFPYSFKQRQESFRHLERLREAIPRDIPLHVEFRNEWWYRPKVFDFLREHDLGFVNVDLPPLSGLPQEKTAIVRTGPATLGSPAGTRPSGGSMRRPGSGTTTCTQSRSLRSGSRRFEKQRARPS